VAACLEDTEHAEKRLPGTLSNPLHEPQLALVAVVS